MNERLWLQRAVCLACLVPLSAGFAGAVFGPSFVMRLDNVEATGIALDSHTRYLSGLLLAIGLAFLSTVPTIERQSARFKLLTFIVVVGGFARLAGLVVMGVPPKGMIFALAMELVITPLLCLWQMRIASKV